MYWRSRTISFAAVLSLLLFASSAPLGAVSGDPLGLRARIDALVRSRIAAVEEVEIPPLERFVPNVPDHELNELRTEIVTTGPIRGDRLGLRLSLWREGRLLKRGVVTVRVHAMRDVVVTKRGLRVRERIDRRDVEVVSKPLAELRSDSVSDPDDVIGHRARRNVREGQIVRSTFFEASPDVVRGQRVKLRLRQGGLRIEALGQAREDGRKGDWIRVLNQSSRREVVGRVAGEGVVHVDL